MYINVLKIQILYFCYLNTKNSTETYESKNIKYIIFLGVLFRKLKTKLNKTIYSITFFCYHDKLKKLSYILTLFLHYPLIPQVR